MFIPRAENSKIIPNLDLEIFIYELSELLNNVIASALFRHCERSEAI